MPAGRPSSYTQESADIICEGLANGKSLVTICRESDLNISSVFRWLEAQPEFRERYTRARDSQADVLAEEILNIADDNKSDPDANSRRLRADVRKWYAGKIRPKKYGDSSQVDVNLGGQAGKPVEVNVQLSPAEAYHKLLNG
jgi:transposase-like protein